MIYYIHYLVNKSKILIFTYNNDRRIYRLKIKLGQVRYVGSA